MPFPLSPIIDDTTRANEAPIQSGWRSTSGTGWSRPNLTSNAIVIPATGNYAAYWSSPFPQNYLEFYATVASVNLNSNIYFFAGYSGSGSPISSITVFFSSASVAAQAAGSSLRIANLTVSAGDSMGMIVEGQTVTAMRKPSGGSWNAVISATGPGIKSGPYMGFLISNTTNTTGSLTSIGAGCFNSVPRLSPSLGRGAAW